MLTTDKLIEDAEQLLEQWRVTQRKLYCASAHLYLSAVQARVDEDFDRYPRLAADIAKDASRVRAMFRSAIDSFGYVFDDSLEASIKSLELGSPTRTDLEVLSQSNALYCIDSDAFTDALRQIIIHQAHGDDISARKESRALIDALCSVMEQ